MLKLIVISTLLCASLNEASVMRTPVRMATIVKEIKLPYSHSYTVTIDSQLYTVLTNSTHLLVSSTAENFEPCVIDFEEHSLQKKIRATVIDKKIIVWGLRAKYELDIGTRMDHTVLIVDPLKCSFKAASTFEEERPDNWFNPGDNIAQVVAYKDSFDVFYPSLQTCAPCRYSIDGKRIDLQYQLKPDVPEKPIYFQIQNFSAPGLENGYFYTYRYGRNEESVIELLDANFRVVKKKNLPHEIHAMAASPTSRPSINVCYMTSPAWNHQSNDTIICESFDSDLQPSFTIRLPMLQGYAPNSFSLTADSRGDLFIPTIQSQPQPQISKGKFINYRVNSAGEVLDVSIVHQLPEDFYGFWEVHGFFVDDDEYCTEYNNNDMFYSEDTQEFVKCVAIPKTC